MGTEWMYVYWPFTLMIAWLMGSCGLLPLPSITKEYQHITSLGERSKFKIWFLLNVYCFSTIRKSKNHKLNRHKLGTLCPFPWLIVI